MKPFIGITTTEAKMHKRPYNKVTNYYDHAIVRAGGIPVLLPILEEVELAQEMASRLDAIIFSGGNDDIDPINYGEEPCSNVTHISSVRDCWEFSLYKSFKKASKPILGICRGCQVINVFEGGTLYQDINEQLKNTKNHYTRDKHICELYHDIILEPDSKLYQLFQQRILSTNSFHHQAVKDVAPGFRTSARCADGVIEAIETTDDQFIVGLQAHPEALTERHPHFMKLFEAFITAARHRMTEI